MKTTKASSLLLAIAVGTSAGCTSMRMKYQATIQNDQGSEAEYVYENSYSTSGDALGCGLTAIFYGGWCWVYAFKPTSSERQAFREHAHDELKKKYGVSDFQLQSETIRKTAWSEGPETADLKYVSIAVSKGKPSLRSTTAMRIGMTRDEVVALLGEPGFSSMVEGRFRWTFNLPRDDRFLSGIEPYYVDFGSDNRSSAFGIDKDEADRRAAIGSENVTPHRER